MEEIHDCESENCRGESSNGLILLCNLCNKRCFLKCLLKNEEVFELMSAVEILIYEDSKWITNINDDTKKSLSKIIGTDKLFQFHCIQCKNDRLTKKEVLKLNEEANKYKNKYNDLLKKMKEQKELNEQLEKQIEENKTLIQELTDEKENPENFDDDNDEFMSPMSGENTSVYVKKTIPKLIKNEMNKWYEIMDEKWNQMKENILIELKQKEQVHEQPKSVTFQPKQHNETEQSIQTTQTTLDKFLKPPQQKKTMILNTIWIRMKYMWQNSKMEQKLKRLLSMLWTTQR